jgi:hypothetical protein
MPDTPKMLGEMYRGIARGALRMEDGGWRIEDGG